MSKTKKNFFSLMLISFLTIALNISWAMASNLKKTTIVLFYTEWNASSRMAREVLPSLTKSYGQQVNYVELDLDAPTTPDKIRSMKLVSPQKVPYIVIIDKKGNIVYQGVYKGESMPELKKTFDSVITNN